VRESKTICDKCGSNVTSNAYKLNLINWDAKTTGSKDLCAQCAGMIAESVKMVGKDYEQWKSQKNQ
jgi:hypothetical protein